jgi:hypothetical protein
LNKLFSIYKRVKNRLNYPQLILLKIPTPPIEKVKNSDSSLISRLDWSQTFLFNPMPPAGPGKHPPAPLRHGLPAFTPASASGISNGTHPARKEPRRPVGSSAILGDVRLLHQFVKGRAG